MLHLLFFINLSPEYVIVSGDKSTLIMRPVFGKYYSHALKRSPIDYTVFFCSTMYLKHL